MSDGDLHERRFAGKVALLRSPERVAVLQVDRVVELSLEGLAARNVLDVGTGTGVFAEAFSQKGCQVAGVDTSAEFLEIARTYVPSAQFQKGAAEALPFHDGSFDVVFLGHLLHETDDPLAALKEARRVSRNRVMVLEWPYREEEHGPPLKHRLRPDVIAGLASEAGFQGIEIIKLQAMDLYRLLV